MKKIVGTVWELPANPAHFHLNWDGLAVLFSRQLHNGSHDFFHIFFLISYFTNHHNCPHIFDTY